MYERSHQLLDDGFSRYQNVEILPKDSVLTIDVDGKILRGNVKENYVYPLLEGEKECLEIKTKAYLSKNNKEIIVSNLLFDKF